jgi:23S rRNA (cytosine1962-C5)-methyltransferase
VLSCLVFEDEHLLVVNKPPGLNTHAPSPYAGEGIYDWLRHRDLRWSKLAIIHRLDKQTSGLILFSKTALANRSLTQQFTDRTVKKKYVFLTDHSVPVKELTAKSSLVRAGDKYLSRPAGKSGEVIALTRFRLLQTYSPTQPISGLRFVEAEPLTGRTHQIRVHAADHGFPILGDTLYRGTKASRVFLHATQLAIRHPETNELVTFDSPADFTGDPRLTVRAALIDPGQSNAWRVCHGASDAWPGWYIDRAGDFLLSQSDHVPTAHETETLAQWQNLTASIGVSHKLWSRDAQRKTSADTSPRPLLGRQPPEQFIIRENGIQFELGFLEGYSVGLFFDQRDNRHRILTNHVAADFPLFQNGPASARVLNTFAYTCGFSVCAAKVGAHTTSLDLSQKYLDWGKRNFTLNNLDPNAHDFIFGEVFDWVARLSRKQRRYDLIVLDPPTFSQSKQSGAFRAEKDYGNLLRLALPLLNPGGVLFASTNAATWPPEEFISTIHRAIQNASRKILQTHYAPQPADFPISREEPAYLKTIWLKIA